ncbi:MFS transporter [Mangrovimonas aestuarii]|uniref:MFS transporter n=1 Tax=Mangrovimonas aestuarii TaxID=3018443 RepID=UPI002378BD92|nr:MFS transporter [Mangrovimonas aestuarii]
MRPPKYVLPIIVLSQFFCTSLWFAGNGIIKELITNFNLEENALAHLTSSVQFGFIIGTLTFAVLTISDRFSPSKVFLVCAILGAVFNLGIIWEGNGFTSILLMRFFTGFFLAGIYPVGMKIASDYYEEGLGKSLGYLVGALVIGTAFPHLLKGIPNVLSWKFVLISTSSLALMGGLLMALLISDGPFRKPNPKIHLSAFFSVFRKQNFRSAAFGYFGHMWELYAFWTFVPIILETYTKLHPSTTFNIPSLSFLIIGIGGIACVVGGYLAQAFGTKKIAFTALLLSCICCLVSPWMFAFNSEFIFISLLLFWSMAVIADSPLFSTLVAQNASAELKGTALTIVNCIGFSITIISIQLLSKMHTLTNSNSIYIVLALGPIMGLIALLKTNKLKTGKTKLN